MWKMRTTVSLLIGVSIVALVSSAKTTRSPVAAVVAVNGKCEKSMTTMSGTKAPTNPFCSGDLVFEDTFDDFNFETWEHENTLAGGGNWEFQWYTNNRTNSYVEKGFLNIHPSLTADDFGETFLSSGTLNLNGGSPGDQCTNPAFWGCVRRGTPTNILNPIKSARLRTINSFAFKYGKVEINAKMPTGDWLWPGIWFLPKHNSYGIWPASGEIDLVESRGNKNLLQNGVNIGTEQMGSTLHFGPYGTLNGYLTSTFARNSKVGAGFDAAFHRYQMEWTEDKITFSVDDIETGTIKVGTGFWARGKFEESAPGVNNPWKFGEKMAPFDQEFYLVVNLAVGGVSYFPDETVSLSGKPWLNSSPQASTDFWNGRNAWLPTWGLNDTQSKTANLQVDYVRVWAV